MKLIQEQFLGFLKQDGLFPIISKLLLRGGGGGGGTRGVLVHNNF